MAVLTLQILSNSFDNMCCESFLNRVSLLPRIHFKFPQVAIVAVSKNPDFDTSFCWLQGRKMLGSALREKYSPLLRTKLYHPRLLLYKSCYPSNRGNKVKSLIERTLSRRTRCRDQCQMLCVPLAIYSDCSEVSFEYQTISIIPASTSGLHTWSDSFF